MRVFQPVFFGSTLRVYRGIESVCCHDLRDRIGSSRWRFLEGLSGLEMSCDPFFLVGVTRLIGCKDVELELDLFFFLEHEHVVWQQGHLVSSIYSSIYDKGFLFI